MKKLLVLLFITSSCYGFSPTQYVQISTNSLSQQNGAINISTATISVSTETTRNTAKAFTTYPANVSIYGNFVSSGTITNGSSVTVNMSGYTQYVARIDMTNKTGSAGTAFLRFNNDGGINYSYSVSGFDVGLSTGANCGAAAADSIVLSSPGLNKLNNNWNNSGILSATVNIKPNTFVLVDGNVAYQDNIASNMVNISIGAYYINSPPTSMQVWAGSISGCTGETDVLTGTTGTVYVWGVQ